MKKILLAAVAACLFCTTFSSRAEAEGDTRQVIAYLFNLLVSPQLFQRVIDESTTAQEADIRALSMAALKNYDVDELARILAGSPLNNVTAEEAKPCLAFLTTPSARVLDAAGQRSGGSPDKLLEELQKLPAKDQGEVVAFFTTPCVQKISAMLQSEQGQQIGREYGEQLMCRHIAAHLPDKLDVVHNMGKCL